MKCAGFCMKYRTKTQNDPIEQGNWQLVKDALNKAITSLGAKMDFVAVKLELGKQLRRLEGGGETRAWQFLNSLLKNKDFLNSESPSAYLQGSLTEATRLENDGKLSRIRSEFFEYRYSNTESVAINIENFVNSIWCFDEKKGKHSGLLGEAYNKIKDDNKILDKTKATYLKNCEDLTEKLETNLLGSVHHKVAFLPTKMKDVLLTGHAEDLIKEFGGLDSDIPDKANTDAKNVVEALFKQLARTERMMEGLDILIKAWACKTPLDRADVDLYLNGIKEIEKLKEEFLENPENTDLLRKIVNGAFKTIEAEATDPSMKIAISLVLESRFGDKGKLLDLPLSDMQSDPAGKSTYEKVKLFYTELVGVNGLSGLEYRDRWSKFEERYSDVSRDFLENSDMLLIASLIYSLKMENGKYICSMWDTLWQSENLEAIAGYGQTPTITLPMSIKTEDVLAGIEVGLHNNGIDLDPSQRSAIIGRYLEQNELGDYLEQGTLGEYLLREDPNNDSSNKIANIRKDGDHLEVTMLTELNKYEKFTVELAYNIGDVNQEGNLDATDPRSTLSILSNRLGTAQLLPEELLKLKRMLEQGGKQADFFVDETGKSLRIELEYGTIKVYPQVSSAVNSFFLSIDTKTGRMPSIVAATILQSIETLDAYYLLRFRQDEAFTSQLSGMTSDVWMFYKSKFGSTFGSDLDRTKAAFEYMDKISKPPSLDALDMVYQSLHSMGNPNVSQTGLEHFDISYTAAMMDSYAFSNTAPEPLQERFKYYEPEFGSILDPKNLLMEYQRAKRLLEEKPPTIKWSNIQPIGYTMMGRLPTESLDRFRRTEFGKLYKEYEEFGADRFRLDVIGSGVETERKTIRWGPKFTAQDTKTGGSISGGFNVASTNQQGLDQTRSIYSAYANNFTVIGTDIHKLLANWSRIATRSDATSGNRQVITKPVSEDALVSLRGYGPADYTLYFSLKQSELDKISITPFEASTLSDEKLEQLVRKLDLKVDLYTHGRGWWDRVLIDQTETGDIKSEEKPKIMEQEKIGLELSGLGLTPTTSQLNTIYSFLTSPSQTTSNFEVGSVNYNAVKNGFNLDILTEAKNITKEELGTRLAGLGINVASTTLDSLYNFITNTSLTTYNFTDENNVSYKATRDSINKTIKITRNSDQADMGTIAYKEQNLVGTIPFASSENERVSELSKELARYVLIHQHQVSDFVTFRVGGELDKKKFVDYQRAGEDNVEEDKDRRGLLFGFELGSNDKIGALIQKSPSDNYVGAVGYVFDNKREEGTNYIPKMVYGGVLVNQKEEISWDERRKRSPTGNTWVFGYDALGKFHSFAFGGPEYAGLQMAGKDAIFNKDELGGSFFARFSDNGTVEMFTGRGYYKVDDVKAALWGGLTKENRDKKTLIGGGLVEIPLGKTFLGEKSYLRLETNFSKNPFDPALIDRKTLEMQAQAYQVMIDNYLKNPDQNTEVAAKDMVNRILTILNTSFQTGVTKRVMDDQIADISMGIRTIGENPYDWKISLTRANDGGRYVLTSTNVSTAGPLRNLSFTWGIKATDKGGPGVRHFEGVRFSAGSIAFMGTVLNEGKNGTGVSCTVAAWPFGNAADDWFTRWSGTFTKYRTNAYWTFSNQKINVGLDYGKLADFKTAGVQTAIWISMVSMTRAGLGYSHLWGHGTNADRVNVYFSKINRSGSNFTLDGYYTVGTMVDKRTKDWGIKASVNVNGSDWDFFTDIVNIF